MNPALLSSASASDGFVWSSNERELTKSPRNTSEQSIVGLEKICLAKFEQNRQPKERSNSASKMGCQFCPKSKMSKE